MGNETSARFWIRFALHLDEAGTKLAEVEHLFTSMGVQARSDKLDGGRWAETSGDMSINWCLLLNGNAIQEETVIVSVCVIFGDGGTFEMRYEPGEGWSIQFDRDPGVQLSPISEGFRSALDSAIKLEVPGIKKDEEGLAFSLSSDWQECKEIDDEAALEMLKAFGKHFARKS